MTGGREQEEWDIIGKVGRKVKIRSRRGKYEIEHIEKDEKGDGERFFLHHGGGIGCWFSSVARLTPSASHDCSRSDE